MSDYKSLSDRDKSLFRDAVKEINDSYAEHLKSGSTDPRPKWPAKLRIKPVRGTDRVFEMTWSFAGPDGRATLEFFAKDGQLAIMWRRIGSHEILKNP